MTNLAHLVVSELLAARCEEASAFVMGREWASCVEIAPPMQLELLFYPELPPPAGRKWALADYHGLPESAPEAHQRRKMVSCVSLFVSNDQAQFSCKLVIGSGREVLDLQSAAFPIRVFSEAVEGDGSSGNTRILAGGGRI